MARMNIIILAVMIIEHLPHLGMVSGDLFGLVPPELTIDMVAPHRCNLDFTERLSHFGTDVF
jgi:hypothetical protein